MASEERPPVGDPAFDTSARIMAVVRAEGMTLKQIAGLLDVSESFISRVARGQRTLTEKHISLLSRRLNRSVPLLVVESFLDDDMPTETRAMVLEAIELLRASERFWLRPRPAAVERARKNGSARSPRARSSTRPKDHAPLTHG